MTDKLNSIVITGPTGAIGMALLQKCIEKNIRVLAICHKNSRRIRQIPKHPLIEVLEADMQEYDTIVLPVYRQYNVLYHLAWQGTFGAARNDMELQTDNIRYTLAALRLAQRLGCNTFVGAGSQAEYGRAGGMISGATPTFPENGYGMAKLCAGQMSRQICMQEGMRHLWVRILSVYGPYDGDNTMVISSLKKMMYHEDTSFTKGEQLWDYLYSEDAAQALLQLGIHGKNGKVYCLGSGQARPLSTYIQMMQHITGSKGNLGIGTMPYSENQVMHLCADIQELTQDTGFVPETSFEDGIRRTIGWLKDYEEDQCNDSLLQ